MKIVSQPVLETERLILRPYTLDDAPELQRLIGEREVARTLMSVPHPYPDGAAEEFINRHPERTESGEFHSPLHVVKKGILSAVSASIALNAKRSVPKSATGLPGRTGDMVTPPRPPGQLSGSASRI